MVRLGFIVEGDTEALILKSPNFKIHLSNLDLELVADPINVTGRSNLMPEKIESDIATFTDLGANAIFLLTDLDDDKCITLTKGRIDPKDEHIAIISVREVEAWFLADTISLRSFLKKNDVFIEFPESIAKPSDHLNSLRSLHRGKKVRSKVVLANEMILSGFSILNAAQHPNCASAKYFLRQLEEVAGH